MLCPSTKSYSWHAAYLCFVPLGLWSTAFKEEQFLSTYLQTLSDSDCSMTSTLGWLLLVWGSTVSMNTLAFLLLSKDLDISRQYCGSSSIAQSQQHCCKTKGLNFPVNAEKLPKRFQDSVALYLRWKDGKKNKVLTISTATLTNSAYFSRYRKSISPK